MSQKLYSLCLSLPVFVIARRSSAPHPSVLHPHNVGHFFRAMDLEHGMCALLSWPGCKSAVNRLATAAQVC